MKNEKNETKLEGALDNFLGTQPTQDLDCTSGVCVIKNDKSLVEKINKKIIIEDGRQLLV